jgi:hypothetical protein
MLDVSRAYVQKVSISSGPINQDIHIDANIKIRSIVKDSEVLPLSFY